MLRGVCQALNCLSIHATHCVIVAGASPGETKMWASGTWKRRFFALAVRITGKLLKIDRYMLRGVWQALNCSSIHATYCVIIAGASPGETKMWAAVRENGDFFAIAVRITGKLFKIDGYMHCCEEFGKHWIVFSFMQRFAWLPQGRPQGKQIFFWSYASYNSETIEDR